MLCDFVTYDGMHFKCTNCGIELKFTEEQISAPVYICDTSIEKGQNESFPTFIQKLKNFAKSTIDHIMVGSPTCSEELIEKRYKICQSCENFHNNSCRLCGCYLHRNKKFVSKLAWADQKCPINKW